MTGIKRATGALYDRLPYKQPMLSILRILGLPHFVYKHLHFAGEFEVATFGRAFRIVHYGDEIENELFWEGLPGRRERVSMALWIRLCQKARTILDAGANSGVYSLAAAAINPGACIYGFEPVGHLFDRYERNCRLNGFGVRMLRVALSNASGTGVMRRCILEKNIEAQGVDEEVVATVRLDAMIENWGIQRIDLAKIDVETHEPEVLEGMGRYLAEWKPTLLIEVLSDHAGERLERLVADLGYLYFDLDEIGPPRLVRHIRASSRWNYLVCSPATAKEVGIG